MAEKYIQKFNEFNQSINDKIIEFINLNDNGLTENLLHIHQDLWNNYKNLTGTSAGFHGIDEHIVFLAFKYFIENLNYPQKFESKVLTRDLRSFEMEKNNKKLTIYRSSRLSHFPDDARIQIFKDGIKLRAPDIAILKKDGDIYTMIAAIEIKNFLDKSATNSAIGMLSQIRDASEGNHTKYALFSFDGIYVGNDTLESLKKFRYDENRNNYLIITEGRSEGSKDKKNMLDVVDLSQFFDGIKKDIEL
ncbi:MAG: hypothetical protein EHM14_10200 [Methanothrix sp.]|nr:MAG: hypothetical protein EHM14_10200 [Methanothrix sp.]